MTSAALVTPIIGADMDRVTAGTTTDGADKEYALGTEVFDNAGVRYKYCQAGAAISTTLKEPYALAIDENFQAVKLTKALANAGHRIGFAPKQIIADNAFFWARISGVFDIRVAVACAADTSLWTTATAGRLDDTSGASHVRVSNVVIVTLASASTSASNTIRSAIVSGGGATIPGLIA